MKKVAIVTLVLVGIAGYSQNMAPANDVSQANNKVRTTMTAEQKAAKITDRLSSTLDLTEKQKQEVYAFHLEKVKAKEAKRKEAKANFSEARKNHNEEYQVKMKQILSEKQFELWKENREKGKKGNQQGFNKNKQ